MARPRIDLGVEEVSGLRADALRGVEGALRREAARGGRPGSPPPASGAAPRRASPSPAVQALRASVLTRLGRPGWARIDARRPVEVDGERTEAPLESRVASWHRQGGGHRSTLNALPCDLSELRALDDLARGRSWSEAAVLLRLVWLSPLRVRPWSSAPASAGRSLRALAEHLFVRYPVPAFLGSGVVAPEPSSRDMLACFLVLSGGGSLRRLARLLPDGFEGASPRLLRPMLDLVPPGSGWWRVESGRRWRLVAGSAGHRFAGTLERVLAFRRFCPNHRGLRASYGLWREALRWLASPEAARLPGVEQTLPYLEWAARAEAREGRCRPRLGHPLEELTAAMERDGSLRWPPRFREWRSGGGWHVRELLDARELDAEGRAMHHCVGSYVEECVDEESRIFSVRRHGRRVLTVEVDLEVRELVQVQGRHNRDVYAKERRLLARWASEVLGNPHRATNIM